MSTLRELYLYGKNQLGNDYGGECLHLCSKFFGADRQQIILKGNSVISHSSEKEFKAAVEKRKTGYPLQYILGYWYFMDMKLSVSKGVLVPREDTEVLVNAAAEYIGNNKMTGADLCSGSGAVALGIASLCPMVKITAAELYPVPYNCLKKNVEAFGGGRVNTVNIDVIMPDPQYNNLDFIVSNPPYIADKEIKNLQIEVQKEPHEALDGGKDGLDFYRAITKIWSPALKKGGLLAYEIGEEQGDAVMEILKNNGFINIEIKKDFAQLNRVVLGIKG